jgi:hypothetical protein
VDLAVSVVDSQCALTDKAPQKIGQKPHVTIPYDPPGHYSNEPKGGHEARKNIRRRSAQGHERPIHLAQVPANVRSSSDSDPICCVTASDAMGHYQNINFHALPPRHMQK